MTRKRGRTAKPAKGEESPEKKVKFQDVSNRASDEENEASEPEVTTTARITRQRAIKEKLKIKIEPPAKAKKAGKKKKIDSKSEDGASASVDSDNPSHASQDSQAVSATEKKDASAATKSDHSSSPTEEAENQQTVFVPQDNDAATDFVPQDNDAATDFDCSTNDIDVEGLKKAIITTRQNKDASTEFDLSNDSKEEEGSQAVTFLVVQEKEPSVSTECDLFADANKEDGNLQTGTFLVPAGKNNPSNEAHYDVTMEVGEGIDTQFPVECFEAPFSEEDNLGLLLMDLEDAPVGVLEQGNKIVLQVEGTDDYVVIPTQSNEDPNIESANEEIIDDAVNESTEDLENQNTENILENKKMQINQEESKRSSPLAEKISDEILMEAAKKIKIKKLKSTKVKQTVSFKGKTKGQRQRKKSVRSDVNPTSPLAQHTVNEEDEIFCRICEQKLENGLTYDDGEPRGGFEEGTAILDSRLLLFDGDELNVSTEDTRSYNKITSFSVYCKNGHLCRLDSGLIEKDVEIYFSGYVKPIHSDDPSPDDGVPGKRFGPIAHWWWTGFDVGENPTVGISTELGDYICMQPSDEYAPFMKSVMTKVYISKIVIEFLIYEPNASYEDLLAKLQNTSVPNDLLKNFTEDTLLHYAPFICEQVIIFDDRAKPKEPLLVTAPCIRRLIDLAGIRFEVDSSEPLKKNQQVFREREFEPKIDYREKMLRQVAEDRRENANASELIDVLLPIQQKVLTPHVAEPWRCGVCERCRRSHCRECKACSARNYAACYQRRCFYHEIMEENEEDAADEVDFSEMQAKDGFSEMQNKDGFALYRTAVRPLARHAYNISWGTKPLAHDHTKRTYYGSVHVDGLLIAPGDFIDVRSGNPGVPPQIMKVAYVYEDDDSGTARIHACFLWSGKYTILGDISDRKELFFVNRCIDVDVKCVVGKVAVLERTTGSLDNSMIEDQSQYAYVCQRTYDPVHGSFHDLEPHDAEDRENSGFPYRYCWVCVRNNIERAKDLPKAVNLIKNNNGTETYESVQYKNEEYRVGIAVYLKPKSLYFKYPMLNNPLQGQSYSKPVDVEKHTEFYRKAKDEDTSLNQDASAPFDIGYIKHIFKSDGRLCLKVTKLYRPENTHRAEKLSKDADANVLYWSDEDCTVPLTTVDNKNLNNLIGKCYLTHESSTINVQEWSRQGPDRFYFNQIYRKNDIEDIAMGAHGCPAKLCEAPEYPETKLKALNIFAGCGGMALGLQQAGAAECKWAIEPDKAAADTFKNNIPGAAVFNGTCAEMMEKISKKDFKVNNQRLPKKGDVDLLCATLPPESWRSVNTVDAFKSCNIATFLVYLEYYQPSFFVMEADDVLLKRSIVLKLALASFIRLGYQVAFDLVQVGNFGAPQNRYRTVIVGAARGRSLPNCPKSQYVFSKSSSLGCIIIDDKLYQRRNWTASAPYKATTVRDAILDLAVFDFNQDEVIRYTTQSLSFYQRMMRSDLAETEKNLVHNHVNKDLGPLVHGRMSQVPAVTGSDWRDLPNVELPLRNKTFTKKLVYSYDDPELGKGKRGQPRGVCSCSVGKRCEPSNVQENTLIPWHLVHSGKRHGHWAGLYGKLHWNGVFVGTSTNPEPLAKKAPVIHPSKNRVLSVRECARAQGFPDSFIFVGGHPIHEMYRQIGLSTSPLLARAIGHEIAKSAAQ